LKPQVFTTVEVIYTFQELRIQNEELRIKIKSKEFPAVPENAPVFFMLSGS